MARAARNGEEDSTDGFRDRERFLKRMRYAMYQTLLGELVKEEARFLQAAEPEPEKWFGKRLLH